MNVFRLFVNLFQFNRTNWKAVSLCFITATIFWFFNSLNKTHTTNIHFPIRFEYDQQKYVPVAALPQQVTLNISGNGWDLFRKYFGLKVPTLSIPLEKPEAKHIAGSSLLSTLGSQLTTMQINFVVTDSLSIYLDEKITQKYKLAASLSGITFKKGYGRISPVVILPDSVALTGPRHLLKKIPDSIVLHLNEKWVNEDVREQVEIVMADAEFINRNPPVADVRFEVGEMMEVSKWAKIRVANISWGTEIGRDSIEVRLRVPEKNVQSFTSLPIWVSIDPAGLKKGESKRYHPRMEGLPAWAELLRVDSVMVKRY